MAFGLQVYASNHVTSAQV